MTPDLVSMLGLALPRKGNPLERFSASESTLVWLDKALTAGLEIPSKWIVSVCQTMEADRQDVRAQAKVEGWFDE